MSKFRLDILRLQPGDILLERDNSRISERICQESNSEFSHARLVVNPTSAMESELKGVQSFNTARILFDAPNECLVLRPADATPEQINIACEFARSKFATQYSSSDFHKTLEKPTTVGEPNREFCTRLVCQAYRAAGYDLTQSADYPTPDDIRLSPRLTIIPDMLLEADDTYIEAATHQGIIAPDRHGQNEHSKAAAAIFAEINKTRGTDIQDFNQLLNHLIYHPADDSLCDGILRRSPYFTHWKQLEDENPDLYNADECRRQHGAETAYFACSMIPEARANFDRLSSEQQKLEQIGKSRNSRTILSLAEMYGNAANSIMRQILTLFRLLEPTDNSACLTN